MAKKKPGRPPKIAKHIDSDSDGEADLNLVGKQQTPKSPSLVDFIIPSLSMITRNQVKIDANSNTEIDINQLPSGGNTADLIGINGEIDTCKSSPLVQGKTANLVISDENLNRVSSNMSVDINGNLEAGNPDGERPRKTFSSLLNHVGCGMSLKKVEGVTSEKVVDIVLDDFKGEMAHWECTLVGRVLAFLPSMSTMHNYASKNWSFVKRPKILYMSNGWFYFQFFSEKDRDAVLRGGPWAIGRSHLILRNWVPNFNEIKDSMIHLPIWVQLPLLDPLYWTVEALSKITSVLGSPICADHITTSKQRISFARVLVEMDISQPMPSSIKISTPFGVIEQEVMYEWFRTAQIVLC